MMKRRKREPRPPNCIGEARAERRHLAEHQGIAPEEMAAMDAVAALDEGRGQP